MLRALLITIILAACTVPALGAQKYRPYTGIGLLLIRPFTPQRTADTTSLAVYRDPGVSRIATMEQKNIPQLTSAVKAVAGETAVAVLEKRGSWLKIAYDEAGRDGWLLMERYWDYVTWDDFLKGRPIKLLPGLKKTFYNLYQEPSDSSAVIGSLAKPKYLRIIKTEDEWCMVLVDYTSTGWLRWHDNDGRFLIAVD